MAQARNNGSKYVSIIVGILAGMLSVGIAWGALRGRQEENSRRIEGLEATRRETVEVIHSIATEQAVMAEKQEQMIDTLAEIKARAHKPPP